MLLRSFQVKKKIADRSKCFHCKVASFVGFFNVFKEITQKLFEFWFPGKKINVIQSFSFRLYEIIIDYLFKVS